MAMFQIGEFSRLAQVTIETLRHYDTIGLLAPAHVDPTTGYRYYAAGQLPSLNHILALKELGFSLDDIARIRTERMSDAEIRAMLHTQLALAEQAIDAAEHRRARILAQLRSADQNALTPAYSVSLKAAEALIVASMRERIPTLAHIPPRWNAMFNTIAAWMHANRLPVGIPLAFYHDEGYTSEHIDTECAFTIPNRALPTIPSPPEPLVIREVEASAQVATLVVADVQRKIDGLKAAYSALGQWIAQQGYHISGAPRERYYGAPDTKDLTVEIQIPVAWARRV